MQRFDKVLVANRGEIARRVIRTCRDMGLATVAVFSDADAGEPHVRDADEAVRLGPAPAADSYLNVAALLAAARRTGAQAVHPGYGFLAENAAFAQAVVDSGRVFIGPRPETIAAMGSKSAARRLMAEHGVPVVPGYSGEDQDPARLADEAARIGFPVLLKASAGGGGKGMAIVRGRADLPAAIEQARRLALAAFGDDRLLLERYVDSPRHVEVQVFGDEHGNVLHLLERECSIQRRFQKVIEETPSPALDAAGRAALCDAGVTAARALGYVGAGTVEFLLDPDGRFYFLEVNTRLQVEHPVTEMVTGLDLVRLQVLVAQGMPLPVQQEEIVAHGHAVECRLYAEDPASDFLPATGRVLLWEPPVGPGLRVDAGVAAGSEVGIHYDPLLAKVVAHAPTRDEAVTRLAGALRRFGVLGPTTNRGFLLDVLRHPSFRAGATHTHFIAEHLPAERRSAGLEPEALAEAALATALSEAERRRHGPRLLPALRPGWRNDPDAAQRVDLVAPGGAALPVEYRARAGGRYEARTGEGPWRPVEVRAHTGARLELAIDGRLAAWHVVDDGERRLVRGPAGEVAFTVVPRFPDGADAAKAGGCAAPMPGRVVQVLVEPGQAVEPGAPLVILEAMKMEHTLTAPAPGVVAEVACAAGDVVSAGAVLVRLHAECSSAPADVP